MEKLTEKKIIQIHDFLIEEMGGEHGVRDPATLSFIVDAINCELDLFRKAAQALFWPIVILFGTDRRGLPLC